MPSHQERVRRHYAGMDRRQIGNPAPPSAHFICPQCPFEGDEPAMIEHAQAVGHMPQPVPVDEDELARMADEGCPNA